MRWRPALTIATWEVRRGASSLDKRTLALGLVILAVVGLVTPLALSAGSTPDRGLYRVAVSEDSPYMGPVEYGTSLRAVPPDTSLGSDAELVITPDGVVTADSEKGRAALAALRRAVAGYNDALLSEEADRAAAFPVRVTLRYAPQTVGFGPGDPTAAFRTTTVPDEPNDGGDGATATSGQGDGTTTTAPTGGSGQGEDASGSALLGGLQRDTPGGLTAPFPVRSLVLAFLFVIPLNVVIQAFGSSVMAERLNRRGEALLVAPIDKYTVVAGKTLPYFLAAILITIIVAFAVGGGPISVLAIAPLAALFLAATFLAAMFARSYKELTFLTVSISVALTAFAFVPAIFSQVTPVAAISPLSVVVYDLTGGPLTLMTFVFSTVPVTLVSFVLFALGVGVFREEDMFTQRPVPAKILDAFAAQLPTHRRVALWSALLVPFAFVAELFAVAALFAVQAPVTIPLLLAVVAIVEEFAKSIHVYAGFQRDRFPDTDRAALSVGILSGFGFALAEKLVLVVQAVGLSEFLLARSAFAPAGLTNPETVAVLLLAPFVVHTVTAAVSALGARRSPTAYIGAFSLAVVLHLAYNLAVVTVVA